MNFSVILLKYNIGDSISLERLNERNKFSFEDRNIDMTITYSVDKCDWTEFVI